MLGQQRARVVEVELLADRLALLRLHAQGLARERGGPGGAQERARVARGELQPEPRQRLARRRRLALAPRGQLPLEIGLGLVWHGLAVPEEPELLLRHRRGG
jgi:hypothetical protein